jgi:hypothetical protein
MDGAGDQTFARARLAVGRMEGGAPPLLPPREKAPDLSPDRVEGRALAHKVSQRIHRAATGTLTAQFTAQLRTT